MERKENAGKKTFPEYYIGLDIGTSSVGWAVTDLEYNVLKFNKKAMWGIRLFDAGKTAEERRVARSSRRRLARRNQRIELLQEIFSEEISKVDMGFYQRLRDSFYREEDKTEHQKNSLFNDIGYTDKNFHKEYPTISHLKVALMEEDREFDARLIYLAIANILKHRGHFIFEGKDLQSVRSFDSTLDQFLNSVNDYLDTEKSVAIDTEAEEYQATFNVKDREQLKTLLKDDSKGMNSKKKEIMSIFETKKFAENKKMLDTILHAIVGAKIDIKNLLDESKVLELEEEIKFTFREATYDEKEEEIKLLLEEKTPLIEAAKGLHDWALLEDILAGEDSIAKSDVQRYLNHADDLKNLKYLLKRDFGKEVYNEILKADNISDNYYAYITGQEKEKGKDKSNRKKCSQEDLCKYLKKKLEIMKIDGKNPEVDSEMLSKKKDYIDIFEKLESNQFLPKQRDNKNAVVPYQLHENDLKSMLKQASKYLLFLDERDESGYTNSEKIIKLLTFRIPYYVGPLNSAHRGEQGVNNWIEKKNNNRILPWSFDDVVDTEASAEAFIKRMTNKCTYLVGADVLPKNSLIYSEFMMLNELNNVKVNGQKLTNEIKMNIIENLFEKNKRITQKKFKDFLWKEGFTNERDSIITGVDGDFKSSLLAYIEFKRILGKQKFTDSEKVMIEDIITAIVLFGENKKILRKRITLKYPELAEGQIKEILKLRFVEWGRLSKEFLQDIEATDPETGEVRTMIAALRNTENNLMELMGASGGFNEAVQVYNAGKLNICSKKIEYSILDDLYVSPAVKRSLWQVIKIVDEIHKIIGKAPKKIFVEVQREEGEKKATRSRKDSLVELYQSLKTGDGKKMLEELRGREQSELNSRALYLYYTQQGRCMYSGERIQLHQINDKNLYDLDHIIPRSLKKDDSLDNLVLVKKTINQNVKKDHFPVEREIQNKNISFWKQLLDQNMISKSKFERLTRTTPLTDNELADFINRQLVETRQSSKASIQVLSQLFPESDVVYSKAGNVSDFRKQFDLIKVREVNDFHHAKDAYLNIVVGNFFDTKFTKSPLNFIKKANEKGEKYSINEKYMYHYDVERGGLIAWVAKGKEKSKTNKPTIDTVKEMMKKNNILYTRKSYEVKGAISDANPLRKGNGQLQLKSGNTMTVDKYGGYNKVAGAYFTLVEHEIKNKMVRSLEVIPVHLSKMIEESPDRRNQYFEKDLGLKNHKILIQKVKIDSLVEIDGFPAHITGRTGENLVVRNALQLVLSEEETQYIKKLAKYMERNTLYKKSNKEDLKITEKDGINKEQNLNLYETFILKLGDTRYRIKYSNQAENLEKLKDNFVKISVESQVATLMEILHFMQCNRVLTNLENIKGVKKAGQLIFNKKVSSLSSFKIIDQSITGLFEQVTEVI